MKYSTNKLIAIESSLRRVSGQMGSILKTELADDLKAAEHILSVVRRTSSSLEGSPCVQDQYTTLLDLKAALFP